MQNTLIQKLLAKWAAFSVKEKMITGLCVGLTSALVVGGGVAAVSLGKSASTNGTENTQGTENFAIEEVFGTEATEVVEETEATETEVIEMVTVTLTATSFEKDLKIKILDESKSLIAGQPFVITVTPEGADAGTDYNDHDMDGIIYIKSIDAGKYTVQLHELEGFVPVENPITATVKERIVYEKVEVKDEIKDESQVDVSKEDTTVKNEVVENVVKDTLPLLSSSVKTDEVLKENIDLSIFPDASVSTEKDTAFIKKTKIGADQSETVIASAEVSLPKTATLYTSGKDTSKTVTLLLNKVDEGAIITDITWLVNGVAVGSGSETLGVVVAPDEMSAVLTMKAAGQTKVSVVVTYVAAVIEEAIPGGTEETTPGGTEETTPGGTEETTPGESEETEAPEETEETTPGESEETEENEPEESDLEENTLEEEVEVTSFASRSGAAPLSTTKTETKEVSCNVTVSNQTDSTTPLKDVNGNTLYLDPEAKTVATLKDYDTAEKFYANPQYTGWQTIDGKLSYYKEDYTYATGKQIIGGVEYEFDETGYLITKEQSVGVDVSKWQGEIDWETVAASGIDFAIIRCGYRGISSGSLIEDKYFEQNIKGATENGIKVGVYVYSQAVTKAEAIEEASMALELVKGYHLQLPIYIDTEGSGGRGDDVSKEDRTEFVKAFCETVKNAGYKPGVYSGKWWFMNKVNVSELEQYHIWVAQYNTECTYTGRYDIWQYTSSGSVPGIDGRADMNIAYRVYY